MGKPVIFIASGPEVALVVAAPQKLLAEKIQLRIVAMPSWELFDAQPLEYGNAVLRAVYCR
ncbi:MAG TPA: transketolase C-terminal domain-containing protein [Halothiobacillus sp.]|nr:transketolase C-terminal domain-containing protein [Halothiobacillus sp.]